MKKRPYFVGNFSENNRNFDSDEIAVCSVGFPVSFFILLCVVGGLSDRIHLTHQTS